MCTIKTEDQGRICTICTLLMCTVKTGDQGRICTICTLLMCTVKTGDQGRICTLLKVEYVQYQFKNCYKKIYHLYSQKN